MSENGDDDRAAARLAISRKGFLSAREGWAYYNLAALRAGTGGGVRTWQLPPPIRPATGGGFVFGAQRQRRWPSRPVRAYGEGIALDLFGMPFHHTWCVDLERRHHNRLVRGDRPRPCRSG